MRRTWDIHGVRVRLESELGVPGVLDHGLRHHRTEEDAGAADIELRIRRGTGTSEPVDGTQVHFVRPLPVDGVVAEDHFWLRAGEGTLDGDASTIEVAAPDADWLGQPTVVRTLLPLALMIPLARRGLFYVHAAVLVDPDGAGWLLAGGGDVGKSTTTYRLLERGWSYVSDDGALLRDDGRVVALSFWDELQLDRAMAERLGGVTWERTPASHDHKGVVATDRLFGDQRRRGVEISRLVVLRRLEPSASTSAPLSRAEAVAGLIDDNSLMLVNATAPNFDLFARLVGGSALATVRVGERMLEEPDSVLREAIG